MHTENVKTEPLNHPPTPEELAEIYSRSAERDPRSIYYQRKLVRPKFPLGWLLLYLVLVAGTSVIVYVGVAHVCRCLWAAVLCAIIAVILVILLLGKHILIAMVKAYQAVAPERVRRRCRFEPSCSMYMIQAVEKYGFWRGLKKGLRRGHRCKPPNGGYDLP